MGMNTSVKVYADQIIACIKNIYPIITIFFVTTALSGVAGCEKEYIIAEPTNSTLPDTKPNQAPIAVIKPKSDPVYNYANCTYEGIQLDARNSTDPDGDSLVSYIWDLPEYQNTHSIFEQITADNAVVNLKTLPPFVRDSFKVRLTVKDKRGLSGIHLYTVNLTKIIPQPREISKALFAEFPSDAQLAWLSATDKRIIFQDRRLSSLEKIHIFDLQTRLWSTISLQFPRYDVSVTDAGNKILFTGGGSRSQKVGQGFVSENIVEIYDMQLSTWDVVYMRIPRTNASTTVISGTVIFAGGIQRLETSSSCLNSVETYNFDTKKWTIKFLNRTIVGNPLLQYEGKIYIPGAGSGCNAVAFSSMVDVYDPATNQWSSINLPNAMSDTRGIIKDNTMFVVGHIRGENNSMIAYNLATGTSETNCIPLDYGYDKVVFSIKNSIISINRENYWGTEKWQENIDVFDNQTKIRTTAKITLPLTNGLDSIRFFTANNEIYFSDGLKIWKLEF